MFSKDGSKKEDSARGSLEKEAAVHGQPFREETSAERAARFAADVRERMTSVGVKAGMAPSKKALTPGRIQLAQTQWRIWDVIPEFGVTTDDMLDPAYWAHEARNLSVWDHMTIRPEDGSWYAEAIVVECGQLYAKIRFKPGYPFVLQVSEPDVDTGMPSGYEIKWTGPHGKYAVIRGSDKLRDKFPGKGAAAAWLRDHLRVIAA